MFSGYTDLVSRYKMWEESAMIKKVHHLGIAVKDIEAATKVLKEALGIEITSIEEIVPQKVKVAFLPVGESQLELLQPISEDSTVAKFLENRGEGLHHIAFETDDIDGVLKHIQEKGLRLIDKEPRDGAHGTKIAFIHPKSTFGVLCEIVQVTE